MRERKAEQDRVRKAKESGERCWCVYASRALGHDTKHPLNQAAVGCRTDIIFNEIITYTEKNALGSVPFMLGIWENAVLIDMIWPVALNSFSLPFFLYNASCSPTLILKFVH